MPDRVGATEASTVQVGTGVRGAVHGREEWNTVTERVCSSVRTNASWNVMGARLAWASRAWAAARRRLPERCPSYPVRLSEIP
eukprot:6181995-Pleurochrysis_carterae.AAC.1